MGAPVGEHHKRWEIVFVVEQGIELESAIGMSPTNRATGRR
ncbi:hypothetical protein ACFL5H_03530 [Candidatus Latescibacterota bacterium]